MSRLIGMVMQIMLSVVDGNDLDVDEDVNVMLQVLLSITMKAISEVIFLNYDIFH